MNPLYFGTAHRRLFGMYHPGQRTGPGSKAAVLCNAWGRHYMLTYRSMRHLAELLAAEGYHVLRFDYYGTGDSGGELDEATIGGYESDIEAAIQELQDMAGGREVALVGLLLGGTLAARVAARHPREVKRLVLWDPVDEGPAFVRELLAAPVPPGLGWRRRPGSAIGELEVRGFPMTPAFLEGVEQLDLAASAASFPAQTLVAISDSAWVPGKLEERLAGASAQFMRSPTAPAWVEDEMLGAGAIPVQLFRQVADWMTQ